MSHIRYALGLDIGGTNLRIGWVDSKFSAYDIEVFPSRSLFSSKNSIVNIAKIINNYISKHFFSHLPEFISIGLPAVLNKDRTEVYSSTNFPGLTGKFLNKISVYLNAPVVLDHDAYYLLAYDMKTTGVDPNAITVGCYFGTGLGGAIFINGRPYVGKNGTASELGHLVVPLSQRLCSCGNEGCIEMYSCGIALETIWKENFPNIKLSDLFVLHSDKEIIQNFIKYMAVPVAAIANILDPDHIFIGGGIPNMNGFSQIFLESEVRKIIRKPFPESNLSLIFSGNNPEKGIIGAVIEGKRRLGLSDF